MKSVLIGLVNEYKFLIAKEMHKLTSLGRFGFKKNGRMPSLVPEGIVRSLVLGNAHVKACLNALK